MARRGSNSFRRNDGIRAMRIARDGGMEPGMLEVVVAPDGVVTFRVYGDKAAPMPTPADTAAGKAGWDEEIEKLKAKALKPKGR
jgi:hypothetical protein